MHMEAKGRRVAGLATLLVAALFTAGSGAAGQAVDQDLTPASAPRLEASARHRPPWTQIPAPRITLAEEYVPDSSGPLRIDYEQRPFFSQRGALIGAAIGCGAGAVIYYDLGMPEPAQSAAWGAAGCVLLALPGAFFGSLFIP